MPRSPSPPFALNDALPKESPGPTAEVTDARRPWTRLDGLALLVLALLGVGGLVLLVHPWYDPVSDASVYLLCARAMAAGEGYAYLGEPFYLRAPGMAALAAPFVGPNSVDFGAIHRVVSAFGVAGVALYFLFLRARIGTLLAFLCALLLWCLPGFHRLGNQVLSDVPGVALLFGCLVLERWSARSGGVVRYALLGLAIGLGTYLRAALVLLLPAIVLSRLVHHLLACRRSGPRPSAPWGGVTALAVVTVLAMAPWSLRNAGLERSLERVDQTKQYSQSALILKEDYRDPSSAFVGGGALLERLPKRAEEALATLARLRFVKGETKESLAEAGAARIALAVLLAGCLLFALFRRFEPAEIFVGGSLLAVAFFPTPFLDRYALPVFLVALPTLVEGVRFLTRRLAGELIAAAMLVAWAALSFGPRDHWEEVRTHHEAWSAHCAEIDGRLPADARIAAPRDWHHLSLFLGRPVYGLVYSIQDRGVGPGLNHVLKSYGLNTVLVVGRNYAADYTLEFYNRRGLRPVELPGLEETTYILRVRP